MAPRPNWKGHLRLSLVSCPIAMFGATTEAGRVRLHTYNRETGNRVRRQYVDADTGDVVEREDEIKGYETGPDEAVLLSEEDLDAVEIESNRTIDIDAFVDAKKVDRLYLDTPYYIAPDDSVGADAFAVIRDAMVARKVAGLGRVVLYRRERIVLIEPRGKGLVATTLRYADEVRDADEYFADIVKVEATEDMVELAEHIIARKTGDFVPEKFDDKYDEALVALIEKKRAGKSVRAATPKKTGNVISLMDALRRSVEASEGGKGKASGKATSEAGGAKSSRAAASRGKAIATKPDTAKAGSRSSKASSSKLSATKPSATSSATKAKAPASRAATSRSVRARTAAASRRKAS